MKIKIKIKSKSLSRARSSVAVRLAGVDGREIAAAGKPDCYRGIA